MNKSFYDDRLKAIESQIANESLRRFESDPIYKSKGKRWSYNKTHFDTFWCSRNPFIVNLMYKSEMYPSYIEIEISTACKYRCDHCEHTYWKETPRLMSWEEFMLIMNQFPDLKQMSMSGIGDSWLNPIFMDCVKYIKSKDVYFEQYDEFQNFDVQTAEEFVKLGVERLIWSMDAATRLTFENKRKGQKWDVALDGIKNLIAAKKKYNSHFPEINFHFVVDKDNINEVYSAIDLVKGLNTGGFIQYSRALHKFKEIEHLYVDVPEDMPGKIMAHAEQLKVPVAWSADVPKYLPPLNFCTAIFQPFFFATGEVIPCCAQHESNRREWEKEVSMGNIFDTKDFSKIWYGERYRKTREMLLNNRLPISCTDCPIQNIKGKVAYKVEG